MNVIVSNQQRNVLSGLDIDIIKSISGEYDATELVEMFKNFFYNKMVLDVTAIKDYHSVKSFQTIAMGLDVEKIVFFLPEGSDVCTSNFLSKLVSMGIYNFTTNIEGVKYLLEHPNTYKQVAHIQQLNDVPNVNSVMTNVDSGSSVSDSSTSFRGSRVIGVRNVTEHAGATTFIYILKKELRTHFGDTIVALELNKNDFQFFGDKNMISISSDQLQGALTRYSGASVLLVDLNDYPDDSFCGEVLYLLEPSTIKLNKLMRRNRNIFSKLQHQKIVLNKSLLSNKDIMDFEYEAKARVFYNMPPLDERKKNPILEDFLSRLGIVAKKEEKKEAGKIFGLFRR